MGILDDEDQHADLGSIGEQDSAPTDPPRVAAGEWPPPVPGGGAAPAPPMPGVPTGQIVTRAVTPSPAEVATLADLDANTQARKDTVEQAGNLAVDKATDQAAQMQAEADLKEQHAQQQAELQKQQQAHIDELHRRDQAEYEKYRGMGLKDPDADASFGHRLGAALAIGLGQYSAAMNHTENRAAQIFEQARRDNLALQRDKIERQKEASIKAGGDVKEAEAESAQRLHDLQTKQVAQIDAFRTKFQAESARMGIPAARIQATATMQDLDRQSLEAREKHLESTRTVSRDLTPRETRAGKGGGGGGAGAGAMAQLSQYAIDHPGDQPGLYRLAEQLKIPKGDKAVANVINQTKGTESQVKDAKQSAIGLRAVDEIEKSGYAPSKEAIQKWIDNQRQVYQANKGGVFGTALAVGQHFGAVPQSETEGLSKKAAQYFANVRRFMETIGRAQSGSAINVDEWTNFYNQYGPNSKGGLGAARTYLQDQARVSGVPGRQLEAGGTVPKGDAAPKAPAKEPTPGGGGPDPLVAKAKRALSDPAAPPAAKVAAVKYLRAHGGE